MTPQKNVGKWEESMAAILKVLFKTRLLSGVIELYQLYTLLKR